MTPAAAFYFDLASPLAYLAAERILHVWGERAPMPAEWRPIFARELAGTNTDTDTIAGGETLRAHVERRAQELELQPVRWPDPFPFDSSLAMRVATYAASIGRTVPFAQAAFRQAFAGGHSLQDPDFVLIAAAACEMHPAAVLRAADTRAVTERLARTTATAASAGVREVPTVVVGGELFAGERQLELAASYAQDQRGGRGGGVGARSL